MKRVILLLLLLCATVMVATVPDVPYTVTYTCTGGYGPFAFTFPISDPTALTVTLNGVLLTSSDYTVTPTNNNYNNGGSVTLGGSFPCTAGQLNILTRDTPITQTIKFYDNMPAPMTNVERGLDKLTEIDQEIWGRTTHSIQMQNNGVNYLAPATGNVTFNYINCIISGPQNDFAITCPTTTSGGSGTGGRLVGWEGTGSSSQLGTVNILYVGGTTYPCDDTGINAAALDAQLTGGGQGTVDVTGCVGAHTLTGTVDTNPTNGTNGVRILLGPAQWTASGNPNFNVHGNGAAVVGPTGTPIKTAQIINNTPTADTICWHDGLGMEVGNLDLEVAAGVTRTAGAAIHACPRLSQSTGHGLVHDIVSNTAPYGLLIDQVNSQIGRTQNVEFGGYAPINDANMVAPIWIGLTDSTALYNGATIASEQFFNVKINNSVAGCASDAAIHLDSGIDTLEMVNVDVGHVPNCIFTGFKMMDWWGAANPGAGGRAPRFSRFVNFSMEGNGQPAGFIGGSNSNQFVNSSWASGEQPTPADHTLVIDNTAGGTIKSLTFIGGQVNSGATMEAVYTAWNPVAQFYGLKFIGMNIGDSSESNPGVYCHMYFAANLSDFWVTDTHFHNIFGTPTTPLCSINVAAGTGDRIVLTNNNLEGSPNGLVFAATGSDITAFGNIGAGTNNNFVRSSANPQFDASQFIIGGTHNGQVTLKTPTGFTFGLVQDSATTTNTQWKLPLTNAVGRQALISTGASNDMEWENDSITINGINCALGGTCNTGSGTLTGLTVNNGADSTLQTYLQSGLTADQITNFSFRDYLGIVKWQIRKTATNLLQLNDGTNPFVSWQTSGCCTTINSQFSSSNPLDVNASTNASTGGVRVWSGGASPSVTTTIAANSSITQVGVAFADLPAGVAGKFIYCTDCKTTTPATCSTAVPASCVCAGSGNGAWAKYMNYEGAGAGWYCQ